MSMSPLPGNAGLLQGSQQFARARQNDHFAFSYQLTIEFLLAIPEPFDFLRVVAPRENFGDNQLILLPEASFEMSKRKRSARLSSEKFPGSLMLRGGVDHDSVPVEYCADRAQA